MKPVLLDANVLVALAVADHIHHDLVEEWFSRRRRRFATCPITQGALMRLLLRQGATPDQALSVLTSITKQRSHDFWPDDLGFGDVALRGVVGHRQVTDAYLAALARHHGGTLATLDQGLAVLHPDVAEDVSGPAPPGER